MVSGGIQTLTQLGNQYQDNPMIGGLVAGTFADIGRTQANTGLAIQYNNAMMQSLGNYQANLENIRTGNTSTLMAQQGDITRGLMSLQGDISRQGLITAGEQQRLGLAAAGYQNRLGMVTAENKTGLAWSPLASSKTGHCCTRPRKHRSDSCIWPRAATWNPGAGCSDPHGLPRPGPRAACRDS